MRFPYTFNIAPSIDTGEEIVVLRPEIPLRIHGADSFVDVLALVDSGADNSIIPLSIANHLGLETSPGRGPGATAFGGQSIPLSYGDVVLEITAADVSMRWRTRVYFADFPNRTEMVVLGHEGFLDYFTATFIGAECELDLQPNSELPRLNLASRRD